MARNELDDLLRKRSNVKGQLTRFETFINEYGKDKPEQLQLRLEKITTSLDDYNTLQDTIESLNEAEVGDREHFENRYYDIVSRARKLVRKIESICISDSDSSINTSHTHAGSSTNIANVRLPKISLPEFNGAYDKWLMFSDAFKSLIHENNQLNPTQKFYYLRSCLKGEAAAVINALEASDANYSVAFDLLKSRFENKRIIIHAHVRELFDVSGIHHESPIYLRKLVDHFQKHIRSLKTLGQPVDTWDTLLIHLIVSKLDLKTKRAWESSVTANTMPNLNQLMDFLVNQYILLETLDKSKGMTKQSITSHLVTDRRDCKFCKGNHGIYRCEKLLDLSTRERYEAIKKLNLCINCLKPYHINKNCKSSNCRKCNQPHNTLLHFENNQKRDKASSHPIDSEEDVETANDPTVSVVTAHASTRRNEYVFLSTALVLIRDSDNSLVQCRALIDGGSQSNFMTKQLLSRLKLRESNISVPVSGINQSVLNVTSMTQAEMSSVSKSYRRKLSFLVVDKITEQLPQQMIDISNLDIPQDITLADPYFNVPQDIDILLGAAIFFELLCVGQIKLGNSKPILQKTKLGWLIAGTLQLSYIINSNCFLTLNTDMSQSLEKFWKIEEPPSTKFYSKEESECEKHFQNTFIRARDGRFTVSLPLKENYVELGESLKNAEKRLISMERKFEGDPNLRHEYTNFMNEYQALGHMSEIPNPKESNSKNINYLTHHCVFKLSSSTTKLRVVFDASCKTSSGIALNDVLLTGPVIQDDLYSILLRFRKHNYVLTGDIAKMYRQINIDESQRDLQRIVWRDDSNSAIKHYTWNTLTYGTAPASFLSTRCLNQLANENENTYQAAARSIKGDFYMDDLLTGADSIENLLTLKNDIIAILQGGMFELRKFNSNHPDIVSDDGTQNLNLIDAKTLGIAWNAKVDKFTYAVNIDLNRKRITKRVILAIISTIFDPLGLIGPVVIRAKLLMQKLWQLKCDWDETVPAEIYNEALRFFNELESIDEISIPRHVMVHGAINIQIHGFADASENAYGASIYVRTTNSNGHAMARLLTAKSRVAPIQTISIPRLELCAALLLSKLMKGAIKALDISVDDTWYWSDSTIVLSWLRTPPNSLKTFVANRVAEIQKNTEITHWRHVSSGENPADVISRGISPTALKNLSLWWSGPIWLTLTEDQWPTCNAFEMTILPEMKSVNLITTQHDYDIFKRYSSLRRLQRVVAYCLRFASNCRSKIKQTEDLSLVELKHSLMTLIKLAQKQEFEKEISTCRRKRIINNSKLKSLDPFLDDDGMLRVGGRLRNANIELSQKHPIILPRHRLTELIIKHKHLENLHAGTQTLLAIVRLEFWPINGKNTIKKILRECTVCFRANPSSFSPKMGCLPRDRTTPVRAFYNSGVDYAGPFLIKDGKLRNRKFIKAYACIFVCFITKAVHIELATDLSADSFLNCFKRFVSRRGFCKTLHSDNATNFKGAYNNMLKTVTDIKNSRVVKDYLEVKEITWNFIPARTPHFGGIWEAAVKSAKYYLKRMVGNSHLSYETLYTILVQIEAVLNSRPLYPLSNDPNDLQALTPGHFLIGEELVALPQRDVSTTPMNRLTNYKQLQGLLQQFWRRWSTEYLHTLQQRNKWRFDNQETIHVNDLVLLKEDNVPPLKWTLGRIIQLHPGEDGRIRVVTVKTSQGTMKRGVQRVCCFPKA